MNESDLFERYLSRLRLAAPPPPTERGLRDLHLAHLVHVPFENLDIHLGRPIDLAPQAVLGKVVTQGRGGFCYELNSAFAWLLERCGMHVELLQARVYKPDGSLGPPFDHLALRVTLGGERFLADVGFGASAWHPLRLDAAGPQSDPGGVFELRPVESEAGRAAGAVETWDLRRDGRAAYRLDGGTRKLDEFESMCVYHQTSPESHFTRRPLCTRLLADGGRVTITGSTLLMTAPDGTRAEQQLDRPALEAAYAEHFGFAPPLVPVREG
ncbi:acetyltransferase [Sorangium cellulosum]|uniref:Acetyltransferase n=1 Tax=Sorangium cellulosum TaxID=56 RepID=A0A2L0F3Y9_SORCE|nr:arylamine N-acetyltransferase [Sorangium cellulosum]AUX46280.1 acetyltransferase [Sorangium cellulosum]